MRVFIWDIWRMNQLYDYEKLPRKISMRDLEMSQFLLLVWSMFQLDIIIFEPHTAA